MTNAPELFFVTKHAGKAAELSLHLDYPVTHVALELDEIQSLDPERIIIAKARAAYAQLGKPVMVEDFSLSFAALGRLPGPYIKAFLQELGVDGLLQLLRHYENRTATAEVHFGICVGGEVATFNATMTGTIAQSVRGGNVFGTDSLFIPHGWDKTWGEMTDAQQAETSVRRLALAGVREYLNALR